MDRVVGDPSQGVRQIRLRIDAVELGRADQAVDRRRALASGVRAGEQVVLPFMRNYT